MVNDLEGDAHSPLMIHVIGEDFKELHRFREHHNPIFPEPTLMLQTPTTEIYWFACSAAAVAMYFE
jgi:hypothetical protein